MEKLKVITILLGAFIASNFAYSDHHYTIRVRSMSHTFGPAIQNRKFPRKILISDLENEILKRTKLRGIHLVLTAKRHFVSQYGEISKYIEMVDPNKTLESYANTLEVGKKNEVFITFHPRASYRVPQEGFVRVEVRSLASPSKRPLRVFYLPKDTLISSLKEKISKGFFEKEESMEIFLTEKPMFVSFRGEISRKFEVKEKNISLSELLQYQKKEFSEKPEKNTLFINYLPFFS